MKYPRGHIVKELCKSDSIGIEETALLTSDEIENFIRGISIRTGGKFYHKAICLPIGYNYVIVEDDVGMVILVPTKI